LIHTKKSRQQKHATKVARKNFYREISLTFKSDEPFGRKRASTSFFSCEVRKYLVPKFDGEWGNPLRQRIDSRRESV
jgi:hypothetical protein